MSFIHKKLKLIESRVEEIDDIHTRLAVDLIKQLRKVVRRHGKRAYIRFSAGYENITVSVLKPSRKGRDCIVDSK